MEKNIPKMYKNKINKKLDNSQLVYSTLNNNNNNKELPKAIKKNSLDDLFTIEQKIYNILHAKNYIYKADVTIVTKDGTYNKRIIGKNGDNLITFDNEYIKISDIKDIYR